MIPLIFIEFAWRRNSSERFKFYDVLKANGIAKSGVALARVVWELAPQIFAASPPGTNPFDVHLTASSVLRFFAAQASMDPSTSLRRGKRFRRTKPKMEDVP